MVNKKKSKKSGKENKNGAGSTRTKSAPPALATTVDVHGRMQERHGRHFYKLLNLMAAIVVPKLNAKLLESKRPPLQWNSDNMAFNSMEARDVVMSYLLENISWTVTEVESKDALARQLVGRRLTQEDKRNIRSWKVHIKDDFFVLGHIPNQGTVLVQVGVLKQRDRLKDESPDWVEKGDFHEPRVFIVQGLSDSLQKMTERSVQLFQRKYPSITRKHSNFANSLCMIHTALLPYMGGITYMTTMTPVTLSLTNHYETPQDFGMAVDKAVEAYHAAFPSAAQSGNGNDASVSIYRSLDPDRDAPICRLASASVNQKIPLIYRAAQAGPKPDGVEDEEDDTFTTTILTNQIMWQPSNDRNHPNFEQMLDQAISAGVDHRNPKETFICEGSKNGIGQQNTIRDNDPCPFHKRAGEKNATFADCCKTAHKKAVLKARKRGHSPNLHFMFDPLEHAEVKRLDEIHSESSKVVNLLEHLRIGRQDIGKVRLRVDPRFASVIQERMHSAYLFHSILPTTWVFWGYLPCKMPFGCMTFGDIELFPETGSFEAYSMTSGRLACLISEMKHVCSGIPILEASLEMEPSYKTKPDLMEFEKNKALLQEGLAIEIRAVIDKEENAAMGLHCNFCGAREDETGKLLLQCACKAAFYCCKDHQKQHWTDHKDNCRSRTGT